MRAARSDEYGRRSPSRYNLRDHDLIVISRDISRTPWLAATAEPGILLLVRLLLVAASWAETLRQIRLPRRGRTASVSSSSRGPRYAVRAAPASRRGIAPG